MRQLIELTLDDGKSVFVEAETEPSGSYRELSGGKQESVKKAFSMVSETLAAIAADIESQLCKLARGPDKVTVELIADIKTGGNLFLFSGNAKGGIKLQLTWERPKGQEQSKHS
jgi:hypothetical protein